MGSRCDRSQTLLSSLNCGCGGECATAGRHGSQEVAHAKDAFVSACRPMTCAELADAVATGRRLPLQSAAMMGRALLPKFSELSCQSAPSKSVVIKWELSARTCADPAQRGRHRVVC